MSQFFVACAVQRRFILFAQTRSVLFSVLLTNSSLFRAFHTRHRKCSRILPSCTECQKRGVECQYQPPKSRPKQTNSAAAAVGAKTKKRPRKVEEVDDEDNGDEDSSDDDAEDVADDAAKSKSKRAKQHKEAPAITDTSAAAAQYQIPRSDRHAISVSLPYSFTHSTTQDLKLGGQGDLIIATTRWRINELLDVFYNLTLGCEIVSRTFLEKELLPHLEQIEFQEALSSASSSESSGIPPVQNSLAKAFAAGTTGAASLGDASTGSRGRSFYTVLWRRNTTTPALTAPASASSQPQAIEEDSHELLQGLWYAMQALGLQHLGENENAQQSFRRASEIFLRPDRIFAMGKPFPSASTGLSTQPKLLNESNIVRTAIAYCSMIIFLLGQNDIDQAMMLIALVKQQLENFKRHLAQPQSSASSSEQQQLQQKALRVIETVIYDIALWQLFLRDDSMTRFEIAQMFQIMRWFYAICSSFCVESYKESMDLHFVQVLRVLQNETALNGIAYIDALLEKTSDLIRHINFVFQNRPIDAMYWRCTVNWLKLHCLRDFARDLAKVMAIQPNNTAANGPILTLVNITRALKRSVADEVIQSLIKDLSLLAIGGVFIQVFVCHAADIHIQAALQGDVETLQSLRAEICILEYLKSKFNVMEKTESMLKRLRDAVEILEGLFLHQQIQTAAASAAMLTQAPAIATTQASNSISRGMQIGNSGGSSISSQIPVTFGAAFSSFAQQQQQHAAVPAQQLMRQQHPRTHMQTQPSQQVQQQQHLQADQLMNFFGQGQGQFFQSAFPGT